ncbi:coproporphyrinogen dehydrogenase [Novosphingobium sp. FSY-8]|uniref:Coproporphyrinogen-III oxidase n=1 Tax=Novosphingobium ovatum TaxID=1908523 RepID=A0ABW9XGC4_9SPHN|nr:radical SAM protein [Novosphingobium ovatum]NBC37472.1 coproporphyrinogen dehydrogenase [Novosphingobium ovatum]
MWPYHPDLLSKPVPRYTSYPTAAEFTPAVGAGALDAALRRTSGDVSLYVHIPFCEQICWYCGCNTAANNKRARLTSYLEALTREIAIVGPKLDGRIKVKRIAFGGGSPNAITPLDFVRLVDAITVHFSLDDPVWSIELDPRTMTPEWAEVMRFVGISRASLGVQTFETALQERIGRVQPTQDIERCTTLLRDAGVRSLNYDLMYGLPGQDWAMLEHSLSEALRLGADRIALFGYAHVPHMLPRQRRIDATALPGQDERFMMAARGHDYLVNAGYVPVGFDHFARPGDAIAQATVAGRLGRNFQGFTEDQAPVLVGLGASSISCFPDVIVQNEKNAGRYRMMISQDQLAGAVGIVRSDEDQRTGRIINDLLCKGHADIGGALALTLAEALSPFLHHGLAELDSGRLTILPGGLPYARTIAALFDPYRQDSVRRFSSAV